MRQRVNQQEAVSCIRLRLDFTASSLTGYTNHEGDYVIKSYRTEIARWKADGTVWITDQKYTVTTNRHMTKVRQGLAKQLAWLEEQEVASV